MDLSAARTLLGLDASQPAEEVEKAYMQRRAAIEARLQSAATDSLREKYREALAELQAARDALLRPSAPRAANLSQTQFYDLPGAGPAYTMLGDPVAASPGANLLEPGSVLARRYEIRERIGAGGMGAVYRAFDRERSEEVALKLLQPHLLRHPTARERFLNEAKLSSKLSHPNIVNVFDVQRDGDHHFITMELLSGQTLRSMMQARKAARQPFKVDEALAVAGAVGAALQYAHRFTVHRDVKPENVWVEPDGSYKLMDFGIARLLTNSQLTKTTHSIGTAYYMAPEQLHAGHEVDGRADQYALAVILYEMLAGVVPAGRIKPLKKLVKDAPRALSDAIDRALEPQPSARYASTDEFVAALGGRGSSAITKGRLVAGAGALALFVLLVASWPTLSGIVLSPLESKSHRERALQAQGEAEALLRRIETSKAEVEGGLREARGRVERADSALRGARTASERQELSARLQSAQQDEALASALRERAQALVFESAALTSVKGQLKLGEASLRDGSNSKALEQLSSARESLGSLLGLLAQLRTALIERQRAEAWITDLQRIAREENRSVDASFAGSRTAFDRGEGLLAAGKPEEALAAFSEAASLATKARDELIDTLVRGYEDLARKAIAADNFEVAQKAVDRGKALQALRSK